jgi:uncharacterized protein
VITTLTEIANRQSAVEALFRCYKFLISPLFGNSCRFTPTCSEYAAQAVAEHGWWRGGALAVQRVLRCHPFGTSGLDPVPHISQHEQLRP